MSLLTVREVAEHLRVSHSTVYNLCANGDLAHFRIGGGRGSIRVAEEQLKQYLAQVKAMGDLPSLPLREITFRGE